MLKRTLLPITDYKFIPERAWYMLRECYGWIEDQPAIVEKVGI